MATAGTSRRGPWVSAGWIVFLVLIAGTESGFAGPSDGGRDEPGYAGRLAAIPGGFALGEPLVFHPSPRFIAIELHVRPEQVPAVLALDLDVWRIAPERTLIELCVSADELQDLCRRGYAPVVLDPDVYATWARQQRAGRDGTDEWTEYHNLATVNTFLTNLQAAHPQRSALITIGTSIEGRPINGIRISDEAGTINPAEPAVFIVGCHHAREWISVEVPLYIAQQLLENYGSDPQIRYLVDRSEIWIVPVLNVDGYLYTETTNRMWRKNRRNNGNGTFGVDLNRNFSYQWGGPGSSGDPGSELYRGTAPFSEPEAAAVRDLFNLRTFASGLSYHAYGQLVMSPWGYTTAAPPNSAAMEALMAQMAGIMNTYQPPGSYTSGRWGVILYIGSGIFDDYFLGAQGILGATIELRPKNSSGGGFLLPPEQILPTCLENYPAALHLMHETMNIAYVGDLNCDGTLNAFDIDPFVLALTNPALYQQQYPACDRMLADCNGDGAVDAFDIDPFVVCITLGACP